MSLDDVMIPKFIYDFAGHYYRPELFTSLLEGVETVGSTHAAIRSEPEPAKKAVMEEPEPDTNA